MIEFWRHPTRSFKLAIPALVLLLAVFFDGAPIPHAGPDATAPLISLIVMYFWLVYRPDLMGAEIIFVASLLLDAFADLPLGLTALAFLLARAFLLPRDRSLATSPFVVIWFGFALAAGVALALRWLLAGFWAERLMPVGGTLFEWVLTVLFYPVVSLVLATLLLQLPKTRHASGK